MKVSKSFSWFYLLITSLHSLPTNQSNHDYIALLILLSALLIVVFLIFPLVDFLYFGYRLDISYLDSVQNLHSVFFSIFKCRTFLYLRFILHLWYSPLSSYPTPTHIERQTYHKAGLYFFNGIYHCIQPDEPQGKSCGRWNWPLQ